MSKRFKFKSIKQRFSGVDFLFSIRGQLSSFSAVAKNISILAAYVFGAVLPYSVIPIIFVFLPTIFGISFFFLPNTPQFYLSKGSIKVFKHTFLYDLKY